MNLIGIWNNILKIFFKKVEFTQNQLFVTSIFFIAPNMLEHWFVDSHPVVFDVTPSLQDHLSFDLDVGVLEK